MPKKSKYMVEASKKIDSTKVYPLEEAIEILKSLPERKFNQTVEAAIRLGIDAKQTDQAVRGYTNLPHGTGKTKRVAVLTQGENANKARQAGADIVDYEGLLKDIEAGQINFDVLIVTPDVMPAIAKFGQVLGPKGLMPNPKTGTVTTKVEEAVKNAKSGQVNFRNDKAGIVHVVLGKVNFTKEQLTENFKTIFEELKKMKPASTKGNYIKKISLSTTMGPGLNIDQASL